MGERGAQRIPSPRRCRPRDDPRARCRCGGALAGPRRTKSAMANPHVRASAGAALARAARRESDIAIAAPTAAPRFQRERARAAFRLVFAALDATLSRDGYPRPTAT